MSSNYPPEMTAADHAYLDGHEGCEHEDAYIQDFVSTVYMKDGQWASQSIEKSVKGTFYSSDNFSIEAQHYCPKCGKTKWVVYDLNSIFNSINDNSQEILLGD